MSATSHVRPRVPLWAMLATPFVGWDARVDEGSMRRYCHAVVERGCGALVVLGVIGEPDTLDAAEKHQVVRTALESGDVPVYAGLMTADPRRRLADAAALNRAFGRDIAGYLVPVDTPNAAMLAGRLCELQRVVQRPLVVQDYPASTGVSIAVPDLVRAVRDCPEVTAIKCEAAPTFDRIRALGALVPDVALISGLGGLSLLDDLAQGATIAACGISRPEVIARAVQRWCRGDDAGARQLVNSIGTTIGFEIQAGTSIAIRKEHWRRQGVLSTAVVRPPTRPYEAYLQSLSEAHGFVDSGQRTLPGPTDRSQ
ncbi:dihydrodipicolinate synthase family protein [Dactylosporangium sp. NPDC000244]|uniref:dihydrodipicolinate synthase family protein n=1 Tax=Dactylosporangium sp. NPDC000244 TaxID=3154365 RepID=UPI0033297A26